MGFAGLIFPGQCNNPRCPVCYPPCDDITCQCYNAATGEMEDLSAQAIIELVGGALITPTGFTSASCGSFTYFGPACVESGIENAFRTITGNKCAVTQYAISCAFLGSPIGGMTGSLTYYPNQIIGKFTSRSVNVFGTHVYQSSITKTWFPTTVERAPCLSGGLQPFVSNCTMEHDSTIISCVTHPLGDPNDTTPVDCATIDPDDMQVPICDYTDADIELAYA